MDPNYLCNFGCIIRVIYVYFIFCIMPVVQEIMLYNGNSNLALVAISFTRAETYLQIW